MFAGGQKAGYYEPSKTKLDHMMFGTVMQETPVLDEAGEPVMDAKTKKPKVKVEKMKTRSGDTVKLADLLDESKERALKIFKERLERQAAAAEGAEESKAP